MTTRELQTFFNEHRPKSTPGILDRALGQIPAGDGAIAYDLCCGMGELTARLAQQGYCAYGVDISDHFIGQAGADANGFVVGDVNAIPFTSGRAQLVCCIDSLQYFRDPGAVLQEMARLLKPGGTLLISTQNNSNPAGLKKRLIERLTGQSWSPWLVHPIENHITYGWLQQTLTDCGLEVDYVRGQQFLTAWVSVLPRAVRLWTPWPDKPWRSLAGMAQRTALPQCIEESALARFAMIVMIRAHKR